MIIILIILDCVFISVGGADKFLKIHSNSIPSALIYVIVFTYEIVFVFITCYVTM